MKSLALALVLGGSMGCASVSIEPTASAGSAYGGVPVGEIRGVADISKTIQARLLDPDDPATATFDVANVAPSISRLRSHLGVFVAAGATTTYQGGTPTPVSAMLWHQLLTRLASAIAVACSTHDASLAIPDYRAFRLQTSVVETIGRVCSDAGSEAERRAAASELWDTVMGIGGTLTADKEAFLEQFAAAGSASLHEEPRSRVANMLVAMFLNPHFLLAK